MKKSTKTLIKIDGFQLVKVISFNAEQSQYELSNGYIFCKRPGSDVDDDKQLMLTLFIIDLHV